MANKTETNQAKRLLKALLEQRSELGDIANELISLLAAAGVGGSEQAGSCSSGSSPVDGVCAKRNGAL